MKSLISQYNEAKTRYAKAQIEAKAAKTALTNIERQVARAGAVKQASDTNEVKIRHYYPQENDMNDGYTPYQEALELRNLSDFDWDDIDADVVDISTEDWQRDWGEENEE